MDRTNATEAGQWLIKADHDLRSAKCLMEGEPPLLDTAVYHCQQAVEKSLKAFLALNAVPIQRVHILTKERTILALRSAFLLPAFRTVNGRYRNEPG